MHQTLAWGRYTHAKVDKPVNKMHFPRHYTVVLVNVFNDLRSEVVARFVDIGGIVDHQYLNFSLVMGQVLFDNK
jgi:hypothetical protein